jgi:imidazoleglycerol-phosphate dehydratase
MTLNLDGTGKSDIHTGIGFFDHMLDGFARHGLFDLSVSVDGDLDVDGHHTIEDTGIVLGTAIRGSRRQTGHPPLRRQNPSDGRDTGALGR